MTEFEARSRWSMAVRCPRMAAYALHGTVADEEPAELTRGYWRRGKQLQADVAASFVDQYGTDAVVLEKPIPWPAGIAHGDIYVKPEKLAVEVKSTASKVPEDYHLLQLAGQIHFDSEAERGALIMVNPSNLARRVLPLPALTDALVENVESTAAAVAQAAAGTLPDRCCERPSDAFGRMCPFPATCFADWEPPAPFELAGDVAVIADELLDLDAEYKQAQENLADVDERRRARRADLRRLLEPAREYASDGLHVKITPVRGRVTYDIATAIKTGNVDEAALEPFKTVGEGYDRFTVKYVEETDAAQEPAAVLSGLEFGDEAPF